ncbi:GNAT family N-acetyltransferase [bacterium]|nr:GNAT family N-acetyltransferase [bacterium]
MPPKFHHVDFSEHQVEKLEIESPPNDAGFRCSRGEFVIFWRQDRIQREVRSSVCQAWYILHSSGFAGYITLFADKLRIGEGEQVLLGEGIRYNSFPAVKIGLLAADSRAKGAGSRLLEWALEYIATELWPRLGIRFVTVDALFDPDTDYDTSDYYRKFGFLLANPHDTILEDAFNTMFLDIMPFVEAIREAEENQGA